MRLEDRVEAFLNHYPLLAKWREDDEDFRQARGFTFVQHCQEVLWGWHVLFTEPYFAGRLYRSFAEALHSKMQLACTFEDFTNWCYLAALGHDLGKCSGEFQQMLVGMEVRYWKDLGGGRLGIPDKVAQQKMRDALAQDKRHRQTYRHEFLSAILMYHQPEIRAWFREAAGSDQGWAYVLAGAFGHHLKGSDWKAFRQGDGVEASIRARGPKYQDLPVYLDKLSEHMNEVLAGASRKYGPFPKLARLDFGNPLVRSKDLLDKLNAMKADPLFKGTDDNPISGSIKWIVILADTFGSIGDELLDNGQRESGQQTRERLLQSIRATWGDVQVDYDARIAARLQGKPLTPFQRKCRSRSRNLVATCSTGAGKTIASFNWAGARPQLPLVYCGHTTDAATCFFNDYADMGRDWLRHSKAWFDIRYRATHDENTSSEGTATPDQEEQAEAIEMIDTLRGCDKDITFTTADQVLGIMAFYRKSVMWLPYLLKSQVVFDEVASYDRSMRAWYFRFLSWFPQIPTAHLSATIPEVMLAKILAETTQPHPKKAGVKVAPLVVHDSRRNGSNRRHRRYRIHVLDKPEDAFALFTPGTLWFTNVVERAQKLGLAYLDAEVYHSRFKSEDRRAIRDRLIKAFKQTDKARVVATQAAEMALDISALRLLSEVCPPASAIQRLGRGNRRLDPDSHRPEYGVIDAYFYLPDAPHGLPYVQGDAWEDTYKLWADWLRQFAGREVSQDDLDRAFQEFYRNPTNLGRDRDAFTTMLQTYRNSVRQTIYTTPCLLKADLDADPNMSAATVIQKSVPVLITPAAKKALRLQNALYRKVPVLDASFGTYDTRLGFIAHKAGSTPPPSP